MATIALPTSFAKAKIKAIYRRSSAISISPYNFTQQVYSWGGQMKVVEINVPPLIQTDADDFTEFFDDLNGYENTFNLDLSDFYPHEAGITSVAMRLVDPDQSWTANEAKHYGFTFAAMEAL